MNHTLELFQDDKLIFYSDSHWLHPLMELELFLQQNHLQVAHLLVKDKIVGRAAALILIDLGFRTIQAQIMSKLAREVLDRYQINYRYERLIERIACQTEEWLKNVWDPSKAHHLIKSKIKA